MSDSMSQFFISRNPVQEQKDRNLMEKGRTRCFIERGENPYPEGSGLWKKVERGIESKERRVGEQKAKLARKALREKKKKAKERDEKTRRIIREAQKDEKEREQREISQRKNPYPEGTGKWGERQAKIFRDMEWKELKGNSVKRGDWKRFESKGILFLEHGFMAIKFVHSDERRIREADTKQGELEFYKKDRAPRKEVVAIYGSLEKGIRGVIHADRTELKSRRKIFEEKIEVVRKVNEELISQGSMLKPEGVERLRGNVVEVVATITEAHNYLEQLAKRKLVRASQLLENNIPAAIPTVRAGQSRERRRTEKMKLAIERQWNRLLVFRDFLKEEYRKGRDPVYSACYAQVKCHWAWRNLFFMHLEVAKCFSVERGIEVNKKIDSAYDIHGMARKVAGKDREKAARMMGAIYKQCRGIFSNSELSDFIGNPKKEGWDAVLEKRTDFERIERHITAKYWEQKLDALLIDSAGNEIPGRIREIANFFSNDEIGFEEIRKLRDGMYKLSFMLEGSHKGGSQLKRAKESYLSGESDMESYKRAVAKFSPGYERTARWMNMAMGKLEEYKAEEAVGKFTKGQVNI